MIYGIDVFDLVRTTLHGLLHVAIGSYLLLPLSERFFESDAQSLTQTFGGAQPAHHCTNARAVPFGLGIFKGFNQIYPLRTSD